MAEGLQSAETGQPGEFRVIAEARMRIQRQVRRVQRNPRPKHFPKTRRFHPDQPLWFPSPTQTVMGKDEIRPAIDREIDQRLRRINPEHRQLYCFSPFNLEPIVGMIPGKSNQIEFAIKIFDQFPKFHFRLPAPKCFLRYSQLRIFSIKSFSV